MLATRTRMNAPINYEWDLKGRFAVKTHGTSCSEGGILNLSRYHHVKAHCEASG